MPIPPLPNSKNPLRGAVEILPVCLSLSINIDTNGEVDSFI
jgi:hypothetical protein